MAGAFFTSAVRHSVFDILRFSVKSEQQNIEYRISNSRSEPGVAGTNSRASAVRHSVFDILRFSVKSEQQNSRISNVEQQKFSLAWLARTAEQRNIGGISPTG